MIYPATLTILGVFVGEKVQRSQNKLQEQIRLTETSLGEKIAESVQLTETSLGEKIAESVQLTETNLGNKIVESEGRLGGRMDKGERAITFHITESEKRLGARFESINQSFKDVKMDVTCQIVGNLGMREVEVRDIART